MDVDADIWMATGGGAENGSRGMNGRGGGAGASGEDPSTVAANDAVLALAVADSDGVSLRLHHHPRAGLLLAAYEKGAVRSVSVRSEL